LSPWVIDASVAVKWYVPEVHWQGAWRLLERQRAGQVHFHVPGLFLAETGNILWKKRRTGELDRPEIRRIAGALAAVPKTVHPTGVLLPAALELADDLDRSVYDCLYLALAGALGCPLATADQKLYRALHATSWRSILTWVEDL
jgi:predicted nucleic acid-binding protein